MYTVSDYREAVTRRDELEFDSPEWNLGTKKIEAMMVVMLSEESTRTWMHAEIIDALYSLNDCGFPRTDTDVQYLLWLLEEFGFQDDAEEIKGWDWL